MKHSTVIGLDLAKSVIQVCQINKHGEIQKNKGFTPNKLREFLVNLKPAVVAMEGCGSCHYWARWARSHGHDVKIISPKKVKGFLQGQKTDANDALAIAVAVKHPGMMFSPIKEIDQQSLQALVTSRRFLLKEESQLGNHIRSYLYEYGITLNRGKTKLAAQVDGLLQGEERGLPACLKGTLSILITHYKSVTTHLKQVEKEKAQLVKQLEPCKRLMALEGVAEVGAAMLYVALGDGREFKNGRQASAYIGVTPKQHSSGGKVKMVGIDKVNGDKALRAVLFQGALAVISRLPEVPKTQKQAWLIDLTRRVGIKRACIALANKIVRTAWALLRTGNTYEAVPVAV